MFIRTVPAAALSGLALVASLATAVSAEPVQPQKSIVVAAASENASATKTTPKAAGVKVAAAATSPSVAKSGKPKAKKKKVRSHPTLKISVDLTRQRMTVREHGKVKHTFKVSSGRKGFRTPTGHYRPKWMTKMHYSRKYDNAPMPHSIFYSGGYAIHATYATGRLGRPASHGCIRLSPSNAKKLYKLVLKHKRANTRIAISGVAKDRPAAVARKKKTYRKSYNQASYKKRQRKVKKYKPQYSYSYANPSYSRTWPGDAPRRRLRY